MAEENRRQYLQLVRRHDIGYQGLHRCHSGCVHRAIRPSKENHESGVVSLDIAQADPPMEMADAARCIVKADGHGLPAACERHAGSGSFPTSSIGGLAGTGGASEGSGARRRGGIPSRGHGGRRREFRARLPEPRDRHEDARGDTAFPPHHQAVSETEIEP